MKYFNSRYLIIWSSLIVVFFFLSYSSAKICWNGEQLNDSKIMSECGVSTEIYLEKIKENSSFCEDAENIYFVDKGCVQDWGAIFMNLILISILYNLIYALIFLINYYRKSYSSKKIIYEEKYNIPLNSTENL